MRELYGDIWEYEANAYVITTNGAVKESGAAVMGRGVAREAKMRFPGLPMYLGDLITDKGNIPHYLGQWTRADGRGYELFSFPVKHHWRDKADLDLITESCARLAQEISTPPVDSARAFATIAMVRPGCGNGQRDWITEVRPICATYLNERFHVIERRR